MLRCAVSANPIRNVHLFLEYNPLLSILTHHRNEYGGKALANFERPKISRPTKPKDHSKRLESVDCPMNLHRPYRDKDVSGPVSASVLAKQTKK